MLQLTRASALVTISVTSGSNWLAESHNYAEFSVKETN